MEVAFDGRHATELPKGSNESPPCVDFILEPYGFMESDGHTIDDTFGGYLPWVWKNIEFTGEFYLFQVKISYSP